MKRFIQQSAARRKNRGYPSKMHQDKLVCLCHWFFLGGVQSRYLWKRKKKKKKLPSNQFGRGLIIQKAYVQPGFCAVVWSVLYLARVKHERHCVPSSWHRLNTHARSLARSAEGSTQSDCLQLWEPAVGSLRAGSSLLNPPTLLRGSHHSMGLQTWPPSTPPLSAMACLDVETPSLCRGKFKSGAFFIFTLLCRD